MHVARNKYSSVENVSGRPGQLQKNAMYLCRQQENIATRPTSYKIIQNGGEACKFITWDSFSLCWNKEYVCTRKNEQKAAGHTGLIFSMENSLKP